MKNRSNPLAAIIALVLLAGCTDSGKTPTGPASTPAIAAVQPSSVAVGDTITITGSNFGAHQGSSSVVVGGVTAPAVVSWSDSQVRVTVPGGVQTGTVAIVVGGVSSNLLSITISGTGQGQVSFRSDVLPIFTAHGCIGCHGGTSGLYVGTVAQLLQGGVHGPAITPGNAATSTLVQKLSANPPFGARMPQGGPYLDPSTLQILENWINQGALDN